MTYSLDLREKVVFFISDGGSKSEAMRIFNLSRDTIYRWLNAEDLHPKIHSSRNRKIDKAALRKHVEDYPDLYLHERAEVFNVSLSAVHYALKKMGIVKKRT
jgi:putative transposase